MLAEQGQPWWMAKNWNRRLIKAVYGRPRDFKGKLMIRPKAKAVPSVYDEFARGQGREYGLAEWRIREKFERWLGAQVNSGRPAQQGTHGH